MAFKPIFKRPEDDISRKVEEKITGELDNRIKTEVDKRVHDILKEREEKEKVDKVSKLAKAVDIAKALKGEGEDKTEKEKADKEKAEKEKITIEKDLLCPTCHAGHVHKVETDKSGLVYKCHDGKCGFEHVFVPKNSDFKCVGCGMPIKKPEKDEHAKDMDGCPFCHNSKAIRFDWSKLWNLKR